MTKTKELYGSRFTYHPKLKYLSNNRKSYKVEINGSVKFITYGNFKTRYVMANRQDVSVMNCCKAVKRDVISFQNLHGALPAGFYKQNHMNIDFCADFFKKCKKKGEAIEMAYVDVNHCYWQIAHVYGIISDKTYEKYVDDREARLVSIGCLKREKKINSYVRGKFKSRKKIPNPLAWVWEFVNHKAYLAMQDVISSCGGFFACHTDGIYLPVKYAKKAVSVLAEHKLECKVMYFSVMGLDNYYLVLKNRKKEPGKCQYKRTFVGINDTIRQSLSPVDSSKLIPKKRRKKFGTKKQLMKKVK